MIKKLFTNLFKSVFGEQLSAAFKYEFRNYRKLKSGRFSRFTIDKDLEKLMNYDGGYYVELGANDGALASNTFYFELKRGWRGVLIEPSPNLYLSCVQRRGLKNSVYCNACVGFDYPHKYVDMVYADSMTISENLDLDIGDKDDFISYGKTHLRGSERVFKFGALAAPLSHLLDDAKAPEFIDLLSLDVEGAELEVLKGVDFSKYKFKYMVIECRDLEPLERFLSEYNYSVEKKLTHHDYLFKLN